MSASIMTIYLLTLVTMSVATPLTCQIGAISGEACATSSDAVNPLVESDTCTTEGHTCLTGKFEGGVNAAYGCYPNGHIEAAKEAVVAACNLDSVCAEYTLTDPRMALMSARRTAATAATMQSTGPAPSPHHWRCLQSPCSRLHLAYYRLN